MLFLSHAWKTETGKGRRSTRTTSDRTSPQARSVFLFAEACQGLARMHTDRPLSHLSRVQEVHHIAIPHHIGLALDAQLAGIARTRFAALGHEIIV